MALVQIRPTTADDQRWVQEFIKLHWGGVDYMTSHGVTFYPARLPGFIAQIDDLQVGLITFIIEEEACEIVTLDNVSLHRGVGSALLAEVCRVAREAACSHAPANTQISPSARTARQKATPRAQTHFPEAA